MRAKNTNSLLLKAAALSFLTCTSIVLSSTEEKKMYISIESITSMCKNLHEQICKDEFKPDLLIGIARGGLIPLGFLAGEANFNLRNTRTINIQSYTDEGEQTTLHLTNPMHTEDFCGPNILVIDDLTDSGKTLDFVVKKLKELRPEATIKIAVLFHKKHSKIKPDYFIEETDKWIVFPWEE